jgi:hypothetical protein
VTKDRGLPLRTLSLLFLLLASTVARAQQPFNTDDAEVTDYHKWHVEVADEYDTLHRINFPNRRQNTFNVKFAYGLLHNVEVGADNQLIAIHNAPHPLLPRDPIGMGDFDFSVKWKMREEKEGSRLPAFAVSLAVEFPTGDARVQLGSGLIDCNGNLIMQKSLSPKNKWRVNTGIYFAGNTLTGALGVKTRGTLFTGGTSFVRDFTPRLKLGVEITGVASTDLNLGRGALQLLGGGNYELKKDFTLDFGLAGGWFVGSPRIGPQLGFSYNW